MEIIRKKKLIKLNILKLMVSEIRIEIRNKYFIFNNFSSDIYSIADSPRSGEEKRR
jgi:hypothetical protein